MLWLGGLNHGELPKTPLGSPQTPHPGVPAGTAPGILHLSQGRLHCLSGIFPRTVTSSAGSRTCGAIAAACVGGKGSPCSALPPALVSSRGSRSLQPDSGLRWCSVPERRWRSFDERNQLFVDIKTRRSTIPFLMSTFTETLLIWGSTVKLGGSLSFLCPSPCRRGAVQLTRFQEHPLRMELRLGAGPSLGCRC